MNLLEAMVYVSEMAEKTASPERYVWLAKYYRLRAKESMTPKVYRGMSRSQIALYQDMQLRPKHYTSENRPSWMTDWQWSGLRYG